MNHPAKLLRNLVPILLLPLAGCMTAGLGSGGAANATSASAALTALDGGLVSRVPGLELSGEARSQALLAEYRALQFAPAGEAVRWSEGGFSGTVVPTQLYRVGSQDCRGYSHTFRSGTNAVSERGTACKTDEGYWRPIA